MEKFSLIDLEISKEMTGRKQAQAVQRERLSEKTSCKGRCDSLNSDITKEVAEFGSKNSEPPEMVSKPKAESNRLQ